MASTYGSGRAGRGNSGTGGRGRGVKLKGTLAELARARGSYWDVLSDLSQVVAEKYYAPTLRRQDVIHPSEMAKADWCPRQTYYRIVAVKAGMTVAKEEFNFRQEGIFATGHAIHGKWQDWLRLTGDLYGKWRCLNCWQVTDIRLDPVTCPSCRSRAVVYAELPIDAEEDYLIAGHSDGMLKRKARLIEIKTIGLGTLRIDAPDLLREHYYEVPSLGRSLYDLDGLWKALDAPLPSHVRQLSLYIYIARMRGLEVRRGSFIYEFKSNQDVKEFTIGLDHSIVSPLMEKARAVTEAVRGRKPPPERAHPQDSSKCQTCPFSSTCWGDSAPDQTGRALRQQSGSGGAEVAPGQRSRIAAQAGRGASGTSQGSDQLERRRADGTVRAAESVGRLRRRPARARCRG